MDDEQAYFDNAVVYRERRRKRALTPATGADPKAAGAITRSLREDALSMHPPTTAPALNKVVLTDGTQMYFGYDRIHDDDGELLVISWKAPVAEKLYQSTPQNPMDVSAKRDFKCLETRIISMTDMFLQDLADRIRELEDFAEDSSRPLVVEEPEEPEVLETGSAREPELTDALLDAMETSRKANMQDIVATIHASQYPIIRAPMESILHVQGGPGTGKTVVALHRVSWLLYNNRDQLEQEDVLIVGPNATFASYVRSVLPMLGDTQVPQMAIQELTGPGRAMRGESLEVRRLKGDARMAALLRKAWDARRDRLATRESPRALLQRVLASPEILLAAAGKDFNANEILLLLREPARRVSEETWSVEDLFLIDELAWMMKGSTAFTRYKHIVVDEAQDLSPMQLRAISRRSRNGSMTVLGDIAQSTGPWTRTNWAEVFQHLPQSYPVDTRELEYGYRLPAQIYALASRLLPEIAPGTKPPAALRSGTSHPLIVEVSLEEMEQRAVDCAVEHFEEGRMVGLIVHRRRLEATGSFVDRSDAAWCFAETEGLIDGINVLTPSGSKGLEFDVVVVVEPSELAVDLEGLKELYVALTRPTQALDIVHSGDLDVLRERPTEDAGQASPADRTTEALEAARSILDRLEPSQREDVLLSLIDELGTQG